MKMKTEKKRLITFIAVAYGMTLLMAVFMYFGFKKGVDLTAFPLAQMMFPAAGVVLGFLIFNKKDKLIPKAFMYTIVITTVILTLIAILSVFAPIEPLNINGLEMEVYYYIGSIIVMPISVLAFIFVLTAGKEKREHVGLRRRNWGMSIFMVCLFILLYIVRVIISAGYDAIFDHSDMGENLLSLTEVFKDPIVVTTALLLPFNYFTTFIIFFGEEYGWRYYLQNVMQKKFGMRLGVILLGVVWGLWHLPLDCFYYTKDSAVQMTVLQIITCIFLAIFFGYAYLKTDNIWVPVALHFLNNNLIPIITGDVSTNSFKHEGITWETIPFVFVVDLIVFGLFIFFKEFKKAPKELEAMSGINVNEVFVIKGESRIYVKEYLKDDQGKVPAVIVSHGFGGNSQETDIYCKTLVNEGYAAYSFDFCGGSIGKTGRSDGDQLKMNITTEKEDLRTVLNFVSQKDYIDKENITLMGISQGGLVSALVAADNNDKVKKLVLMYPAFCVTDDAKKGSLGGGKYDPENVPETIECPNGMTIGKAYYDDVVNKDFFADAKKFTGKVLLMHGTKDSVVDYNYSVKLKETYAEDQCTLHAFEGQDHGFDEEHTLKAISLIKDFVKA